MRGGGQGRIAGIWQVCGGFQQRFVWFLRIDDGIYQDFKIVWISFSIMNEN